MTSLNLGADQKRAALPRLPNVGARIAAMAVSVRYVLMYAVLLGIGMVLGFVGGIYAGANDGGLKNEIALQIMRGAGNLNDVRQKVDYLCKSGFIDGEKNSWRRRWLNVSNPCDNPAGK